MKFLTKKMFPAFCIIALACVSCTTTENNGSGKSDKLITIGTGGINGVYYPAGKAIAQTVNESSDAGGIRTVAKTAYNASKYNIVDVLNHDLNFGISQLDDLYDVYKNNPEGKKLRAVFCLHMEALTLLALNSSGIHTYKDLKNHKVRTGASKNINRNIQVVLNAYGINPASFKQIAAKSILCPDMLQKNKIDAYFFTVGHPNPNTKDAVSGKKKVNIIPIDEKIISTIVKKYPYYRKVSIPLSYYMPEKGNIPTIGTKAVFFTTEDTDEQTVYEITKAVFSKLEKLKSASPALMDLTTEDMLTGYLLPLHKGALKFYKEKNLSTVSGD
jgi:TRAP transporter TAXI family solute receptor